MSKIYRRHVDADTCVHLDEFAALDSACCWPELMEGQVVGYSPTTNAIVPVTDPVFGDVVTGDLTVCGELKACSTLDVACDAHFNGNVSIAGTLTYTNEEVINSTADEIVLRQNNPSALTAGQYSGMVINNSQGSGTGTAIIADCTGTVRVGNTSGTETTYADAYLSKSDAKWYEDEDLTTEITPQPSGELTAWDESHSTEDYYYYKNAIFTVYSYTSTQPLATREEESNMADAMPVIWDASCNRIVTTAPANGCACMGLVTCIDEVTGCLGTTWQDMHPAAVSCHYATMADFNADIANIPNDAFVIIDECNDYIYSEDR